MGLGPESVLGPGLGLEQKPGAALGPGLARAAATAAPPARLVAVGSGVVVLCCSGLYLAVYLQFLSYTYPPR